MISKENEKILGRLMQEDLNDLSVLIDLLSMAALILPENAGRSKEVAKTVESHARVLSMGGSLAAFDLYNDSLLFLAKYHRDFDAYLLYVEKERDVEERFYLPRRRCLSVLVKQIQRLIDDEIDILSISMPPGTGKTTLGEFFLSFVMGHYPDVPNLMSSHSGYVTQMFYEAVLNIIASREYAWADVFPDVMIEDTNGKNETINLGRFKPFKTLTCRPIRGSLTGVTRCEGFLYVDDIVSGIEEAMSKERLDKLYDRYTTDLKSRKKQGCKEIHIATRWSVHDVIGRLQRLYGDDGRAEFIAMPDINPETGESNFDYDYGVGFSKEYFADMENSMDDVSYRCLYRNDPIEREGILYHPDELRRYMGDLPENEPDAILACCDTKDSGTDYNFLGVFYQYGNDYYLHDCVFKNIDPGTLDELNANCLIRNHVQRCQFESNKEGSRTAQRIEELIQQKGGRCHITRKYSTVNKETKIIVNSSWVKNHVIFKDPTVYTQKEDYGVMMSYLCSYSQLGKNIHDDAPDLLAMFAIWVDGMYGAKTKVIRRTSLGF